MLTSKTRVSPIRIDVDSRHRLRRNRLAFAVSMCMLLNVALMPMKAYLSEALPWTHLVRSPASSNFTQFNQTTLELYQQIYNTNTLPLGTTYFDDSLRSVNLVRMVFNMSLHQPISRDECVSSFILGLPGVPFYAEGVYNLICSLAAMNGSMNSTYWHNRGICTCHKFFTVYAGYQCVWFASGNDIMQLDSSQCITLYSSFTGYGTPEWLWCKFIFRVLISLFTLQVLWQKYYKHCFHLEQMLVLHGHKANAPPGQNWSYEVVWGDPTAMVLMNPYIAAAFTIDCWFSVDRLGMAMIQLAQTDNKVIRILGTLYLSRTVWFAYVALCITSIYLKRRRKEYLFVEVDPTLVAIATAVYGPVVCWAMSNISFMLKFFHVLFESTVPKDSIDHEVDGCLASTSYTLIVAIMPIVCGLSITILRKKYNGKLSAHDNYGNYDYNNIKTRFVFYIMRVMHGKVPTDVISVGGTIYQLFKSNPRYKQCPTISFRSTDCFVHCYHNGKFCEKLRLSLLTSLDQNMMDKDIAVQVVRGTSRLVFNTLLPPDRENLRPRLLTTERHYSPWCI